MLFVVIVGCKNNSSEACGKEKTARGAVLHYERGLGVRLGLEIRC
jgi:hypothetical protein